jgi:hypothetical protein
LLKLNTMSATRNEQIVGSRYPIASTRRPSADHQTQERRTKQTPRRRLQDQRQPCALHGIPHDGDPDGKSPARVTDSVDFRDALFGCDGSRRRLRHESGERKRLVETHHEVGVGDVHALTGRAADLDVVRQRKELMIEPVGPRRLFHHRAHHRHRVVGGGHRGAECGDELGRCRVALLMLGWHGRRLLPGVA